MARALSASSRFFHSSREVAADFACSADSTARSAASFACSPAVRFARSESGPASRASSVFRRAAARAATASISFARSTAAFHGFSSFWIACRTGPAAFSASARVFAVFFADASAAASSFSSAWRAWPSFPSCRFARASRPFAVSTGVGTFCRRTCVKKEAKAWKSLSFQRSNGWSWHWAHSIRTPRKSRAVRPASAGTSVANW